MNLATTVFDTGEHSGGSTCAEKNRMGKSQWPEHFGINFSYGCYFITVKVAHPRASARFFASSSSLFLSPLHFDCSRVRCLSPSLPLCLSVSLSLYHPLSGLSVEWVDGRDGGCGGRGGGTFACVRLLGGGWGEGGGARGPAQVRAACVLRRAHAGVDRNVPPSSTKRFYAQVCESVDV